MFTLNLDTDNAAFRAVRSDILDDADEHSLACRMELLRILRRVAGQLETGTTDAAIMDANGNRVGQWALES